MLRCRACGREYREGPEEPWRCECGGPLDFDRQPTPADSRPRLDRGRGLWAFGTLLAVPRRVSLGEGFTPLVEAPHLDASVKLEYCSPTGSFKDRGAATTLSRAVDLGVDRVVEDSSGNAGLAIATYAARAGIDAEIFVPADAKSAKRSAIERTGATVRTVHGTRADVARACVERVEEGGGWYASHAWNPAFFAGTATFAMELAAQRGWRVPDAVVLPIGHGTLYLGAYRGFRALERAGWIDGVPRLLGAQAAGCSPIVDALPGGGGSDAASGEPNDLADGIQIGEPVRAAQILDAVEATGGDAIAVDEGDTRAALDGLRRNGFDVEPTSAVAPAALEHYRKRGVIDEATDVVVPLTGRAK